MTRYSTGPIAIAARTHEIVNYFGKCPDCGYTATAAVHITSYLDGTVTSIVMATCAMPCGWTGPVRPTTMGGEPPVFHSGPHFP